MGERDAASSIDRELWLEVSPYLDEVLEIPEGERAAWLSALRARDPLLAARVDALLQAHGQNEQEHFLERSPDPRPLGSIFAGRRIGAYTIRSLLGEGGMGSVWLADRTDGELQQQVAIKFLGGAGLRPAWRDRFLQERQLLASLNHRSIVRLLDAGRTDDGLLYLVMEFVEGEAIDQYAARLPVRERMHLFLQVCDAVSYAHRRLIVHRDLKPSNILVEGSGQPKLLDFGIARLLDDGANPTVTVERVLTPRYASPEQFRGTAPATSTDVYSLGAILFRLLTGHSPREAEGDATGDRMPPATRLNPALPSDVDYVLRRAVRYEPDERYTSVEALASDVRAILESRPVQARSGDAWYRARKFLRRHRSAVATAVLVFVSLGVGLYTTNRQRAIAERRFAEVRQLANQFIALDARIRDLPGSTAAREQIVSESLAYLARLSVEARGDRDLAFDLGTAYLRIARVQGVPSSLNLGQFSKAEESLQKADELIGFVLAANPRDRRALLTSAEIAHDRMVVLDAHDRRDEALTAAREAASALDRFLAQGTPTAEEIAGATLILSNIATAFHNSERFDQAIAFARRALAISDGVEAARMYRATALGNLSENVQPLGRLEEALAAMREARSILEQLAAGGGGAAVQGNLIIALTGEGTLIGEDSTLGVVNSGVSLNRPAESLVAFQRALDLAEALSDRDPQDYRSRRLMALPSLQIGAILRHSDPARALAVFDRALARLREVPANARADGDASRLLVGSSYAARALDRRADAARRLEEAFGLLRATKQYPTDRIQPGRDVYFALRALADHHADAAHLDKAVEVYEELLAKMTAWNADPEANLRHASAFSNTWAALSALQRRLGRTAEARALDDTRATLWRAWEQKSPDNPFVRRQLESLDPR
jgi:serine/threonine protein kinase/tetratricopeptide (TPR) repeat protein